MKFAHSIALAAATVSLSEALTFNKTAAYAPGQYDKYKCIDTEGVNDMFPQCIRQCQRDVNRNDGCAYDDFACHCANYDVYAPLIEDCAFPPSIGGNGNCTFQELGMIRPVVTDLCNFFNATGYTAYAECGYGQSGRHSKVRKGHHWGRPGWGWFGRHAHHSKGAERGLSTKMTFDLIAGQDITILDQ